MRSQILGALKAADITPSEFAKLCGISPATFYRHLRDTDKLTMKEIRMLERYTNIERNSNNIWSK